MKKEFRLYDFARVLISLLCLCLCVTVAASSTVIAMAQWENMPGYRMQIMKMVLFLLLFLPFLLYRRRLPPEAIILAAYAAWSVVVPVVHGELSYALIGAIRITGSVLVVFLAGLALEGRYREGMLKLFTAFFCGVLLVWAWYGFRVVLTDVKEIPLTDLTIHIAEKYVNIPNRYQKFLEFFNFNRNISAVLFMNGFWLLAIQWFSCKRRYWRIPIAGAMLVMYLIMALQHCRTVYIAMAVGAGMLAILLLMPRMKARKQYQQIFALGLAAVLAMGITYKGFGFCENMLIRFASSSQTAQIPEESVLETSAEEVSNAGEPLIADNRELLGEMGDMGGRKILWQLTVKLASRDGKTLVFGQPEREIANNIQAAGQFDWLPAHAHNMFLQLLAQYGLPGMLLGAAFVLLLVIRMLRLYFGNGELCQKVLTIPLACLLLHGIMEPLLSFFEPTSVQFALVAGAFVGISLEQSKKNDQSVHGLRAQGESNDEKYCI